MKIEIFIKFVNYLEIEKEKKRNYINISNGVISLKYINFLIVATMKKKDSNIMHSEYELNRFLNIALSSSKIKTLSIVGRKARPQIHVLLYGSVGSAKSTIMHNISDSTSSRIVNHFTKAHIYGSVDEKTGVLIEPLIWDCRNSCILIDEFHYMKNNYNNVEMMKGLLQVLEFPEFSKKVGHRANPVDKHDDDLYLKVDDSNIRCKSRFSAIINTMMNLSRDDISYDMHALMSRCISIPHYPKLSELVEISRGKKFFNFKPVNVDEYISISKKNYDKIIEFILTIIKNPRAYLRLLDDCCRVFAVLKKHDYELYKILCDIA